MKAITFECETITPMFLGGADGRTPELRAPSIKGLMRFWWRAMNGHLSPEDLKEEEVKIFGGSGKKEGKSSFSIKIKEIEILNGGQYPPLPHHTNNWCNSAKGCKFSRRGKCTKSYKSACISVNSKFETEILLNDPSVETTLKNLFILTSVLGGLGKRARRGFGCFKIIEGDNEQFPFDYSISSISNLLNSIEPNFKIENDKIVMNKEAHQEAIYPYVKEIELGEKVKKYGDLLLKISKNSSEFDCYYTGFAEKIHLKNKSENKRLSSPIYISILSNNGFYHPIITTLNCVFEKDVFDRLKNKRKKSDFSKNFKQAILAGGNYDG